MIEKKWADDGFLDEMERVCDPGGDVVVHQLFGDKGELWKFVSHMKNMGNTDSKVKTAECVDVFFGSEQCQLPKWIDNRKVALGQALFEDYWPLTITGLFCSSLPECYVIGDESIVLDKTGQLEDHTLYRVRQTARFVFSVMAEGGLTGDPTKHGPKWVSGHTQTLVVRMIHSIIRHLIENPEDAATAMRAMPRSGTLGAEPDASPTPDHHPHGAWMSAFGSRTNPPAAGMLGDAAPLQSRPINQLQLAYTLLTFSYVIIRSLRHLGVEWTEQEEEAYIHTWNVVAHILGVRRELMVDNYADAEVLFERIKARGIANRSTAEEEAGHRLTVKLLEAMASTIKWTVIKPLPFALTHYLIGRDTSGRLGLQKKNYGFLRTVGFHSAVLAIRIIVSIAQFLGRRFRLVHWVIRHFSHAIVGHLMDTQTMQFYAPTKLKEVDEAPLGRFGRWIFHKPT